MPTKARRWQTSGPPSKTTNNPQQNDPIVFWNEKRRNVLDFLPNIIFVECKNLGRPLSNNWVREFESKLRNKGLSFGILVALNGVTGKPSDRTAAYHVLDRALSEQRQIILITRADIENFRETSEIIQAVKQKICKLDAAVAFS
ncbi:MAG: hypothetical protein P8X90_30205 [Desulfobacterales bacterium]